MPMEADRLNELLSLQILDTDPEAQFDEITVLASDICQTPMAMITLVDQDRLWYKSKVGYDQTQDPRHSSLCDHITQTHRLLVVENLQTDSRFKDGEVPKRFPNLRFYAGIPLLSSNGYCIGSFCVMDSQPRTLTDWQINALGILSRNIVRVMELRRQNQEISTLATKISQKELLLVEAAKMSSLGQMAGGIAHEINNPLTIISLYGTKIKDLAGSSQLRPELLSSYADKIQETTMRIARIIRGLREFCGDGEKEPLKLVSMQRIVEDTLSFCHEKKLRMGIQFKLTQPEESLDVECRPILISQVILNLMNNACDALTYIPQKNLELEIKQQHDWIQVSVYDNGHGISDDHKNQIFNPFFTTKEIGQGIGLGLSISKGIAESHGGTLTFESNKKGTVFHLRLPRRQSEKY